MQSRQFIDFGSPIRFKVKITHIKAFRSIWGDRIFIRGNLQNAEANEVEFFCPLALEFILREINVKRNDLIEITYYGCKNLEGKSNSHPEQLYYAEKISDNYEGMSTMSPIKG